MGAVDKGVTVDNSGGERAGEESTSDVRTTLETMFDTMTDPLATAGIGDPTGMGELDPAELVAAVESSYRLESMLMARRLAAVAALLWHRVSAAAKADGERDFAVIDGFEQTTAEVAAAMNLSPMGTSYLVSYAEALDVRLPKVAALLAEGRTDWRTVRLIIGRTELVTDEALIAHLARLLAAVETILHEEITHAQMKPPLPPHDLAYPIVRIVESFLYADLITGEQPDIAKAKQAISALLGGDGAAA
jgi:hypothetical protein